MGKPRHAYRTHGELLAFHAARAKALNAKDVMWRCPYCDEIPDSVREHLKRDHDLGVDPSGGALTWGLALEAAASLQGAKIMHVDAHFSTLYTPGFCTAELRAERWTRAHARPEDALAIWICEHLWRLIDLGFSVRFVPAPKRVDGKLLLSPDLLQILMSLDPHGPRWYPDWFDVLDAWLVQVEREQEKAA